jgi:hypothetical protein
VLYATFVGGSGDDAGARLVVVPDNRIAVVGQTTSPDLPLLPAEQQTPAGVATGFVTIVDAGGAAVRSYALAGRNVLPAGTAAFGPDGSLYVAGHTTIDTFPAINAVQPERAGQHDLWIVKYSTTGEVVYSTYIGGVWPDLLAGIAGDAVGRVYILGRALPGWTQGPVPFTFPLGYPEAPDSNWNVTLVKLHASGAVANAVQLGGTLNDNPAALALGPNGDVYLAGTTYSFDFPLVHAVQDHLSSGLTFRGEPRPVDMFVTKLRMRMGPWPVTEPLVPGQQSRVILRGEEFHGHMQVFIGGQWATDIVVHDRTSMSVTAPPLPAGLHDIIVIDSYGDVVTLPNSILYGACGFDLGPGHAAFLGGGASREVTITTDVAVCGWTAVSDGDWVTVQPAGGTGTLPVRLTVQPNPGRTARSATITVGGQSFTVTQAGSSRLDVNGDGWLDLLWRHQEDGSLAAWTMIGPVQIAGNALAPPQVQDLAWTVIGNGDFDRDGAQDLVWQHLTSGSLAVWLMDGLTLREAASLSPSSVADLDWRVRAVGDLDGDGAPDLIWHHRTSGHVAAWLMDGLRSVDARLLSAPVVEDPAWQLVGAGDFTGTSLFSPPDGQLDLVWQHDTDARVAIWTMQGMVMTGGRDVQWFPPWRIEGIGDLTGDNELDFIVRDPLTGELRLIRYNPRVLTGSTIHAITPPLVPPSWRIVAPR